MTTLGILGGLGSSEIIILLLIIVVLGSGVIAPIMWFQERKRRKYWQAKAEDYEKKLIDKK